MQPFSQTGGQDTIAQSLREEGYRLTPQRMMILSIIHDSEGHITAEEIHRRVCQQYPFVDISTVYRTLNLLKKLHLITETDLGGGCVRYELLEQERHHHLVCRHCGETFALSHQLLEPLRLRLLKEYGFAANLDHFAIFGLCLQCRRAQKATAKKVGKHGAD